MNQIYARDIDNTCNRGMAQRHHPTKNERVMIYTSYYSNREIKQHRERYCLIAISRYRPTWTAVDGAIMELAPTLRNLDSYKRTGNESDYTLRYWEENLKDIEPNELTDLITDLAGDRTPVLLCYERTGLFCHRHLVSKWLRYHHIDCEELISRPTYTSSARLTDRWKTHRTHKNAAITRLYG